MLIETKILVCDDHSVFRLGLKTLLEKGDFLVHEAANTASAVKMALACNLELIIMDYILPDINGIQAIEEIRQMGYQKKIILLSNVFEMELLDKCREVNLDGYISKSESLETIRSIITSVLAGEKHFKKPNASKSCMSIPGNPFVELTEREIEIVRQLVTGKSQKKIAAELFISLRTLEKHRQNISQKLGKMSLPELTRQAFI